ncbi:MAG: hypothetical protein PWP50_771 [Synergistaceae bacterium]|jgi:hypothetical protein|nr:hypothetical protein [Synergistaceae bacterium]
MDEDRKRLRRNLLPPLLTGGKLEVKVNMI